MPVLGLHLKYPLSHAWSLVSSAELGGLPRVDSLRKEGGNVKIKQTNNKLSIGVARAAGDWEWSLSAFDRNYVQDEQSHEDSNVIHLRDRGLVVGLTHAF